MCDAMFCQNGMYRISLHGFEFVMWSAVFEFLNCFLVFDLLIEFGLNGRASEAALAQHATAGCESLA